MYTGPAELLADGRSEILEVGFGIGFGLEVLTRKNCFRRYVGVEIDGACYDYVRSLPVGQRPDVTLLCGDFRELALDDQFDYAFCIEVIDAYRTGRLLCGAAEDPSADPQDALFKYAGYQPGRTRPFYGRRDYRLFV